MAEAVQDLRSVAEVVTARLGPYGLANYSRAFAQVAAAQAARADVVHVHGAWLHPNWAATRAALRQGKPVVRSPRGMLSEWGLRRSPVAKRLVWLIHERRQFARSHLIHATSEQEATEVRRVGLRNPIAVIVNGLDLRRHVASERLAATGAATGRLDSPRRVLFLSRIHPKKGLDLLLSVWSSLPPDMPARLLIAGTASPGAAESLARTLRVLPGPPAEYLGPVRGEEKFRLLASAWILVLPSWNENYGMVIAEALASGTPVIATRGTPWESLETERCGWWIDRSARDLRSSLLAALAMGEAQQAEMARRGRLLIEREHSAEESVRRMEAAYNWTTGACREPPGWIRT